MCGMKVILHKNFFNTSACLLEPITLGQARDFPRVALGRRSESCGLQTVWDFRVLN